MSQIWEYYTNLCTMNEQEIPSGYLSRRKSFYEAVTQIVGVSASTSRQLDPKLPLMLYPRDITNMTVSKTLKKTILIDHSNDFSLSSDEECPKFTPDATPLQEIFHTALQLRADLNDSPGHDTSLRCIDIEHV